MIVSIKNRGLTTRIRWLEHYSVNQKKYRKAVSILITIVLGALLLSGLYLLFGNVILPLIQERIMDMFNFSG